MGMLRLSYTAAYFSLTDESDTLPSVLRPIGVIVMWVKVSASDVCQKKNQRMQLLDNVSTLLTAQELVI
jgi:hypothetical protein